MLRNFMALFGFGTISRMWVDETAGFCAKRTPLRRV